MDKLKKSGSSIELYGTLATTSFRLLNIIHLFLTCHSDNYTWDLQLALRSLMPLVLRVVGHHLYYQKPLTNS